MGDVSKWEVNFKEVKLSPEDVQKNKKLAMMVILPSQTAALKNMQKVFGHLNVQMTEQSEFLGIKRSKRYVRAMTELCNEQIEYFAESTMIFSALNNSLCNIFRKICEGEDKLLLPQPPANPPPNIPTLAMHT